MYITVLTFLWYHRDDRKWSMIVNLWWLVFVISRIFWIEKPLQRRRLEVPNPMSTRFIPYFGDRRFKHGIVFGCCFFVGSDLEYRFVYFLHVFSPVRPRSRLIWDLIAGGIFCLHWVSPCAHFYMGFNICTKSCWILIEYMVMFLFFVRMSALFILIVCCAKIEKNITMCRFCECPGDLHPSRPSRNTGLWWLSTLDLYPTDVGQSLQTLNRVKCTGLTSIPHTLLNIQELNCSNCPVDRDTIHFDKYPFALFWRGSVHSWR